MAGELIVKKSELSRMVGYLIHILCFIGGIILFFEAKYLPSIALAILSPFNFYWHHKEFIKKQQIFLRISEKELWTEEGGYKTWESIICIKFRYERGHTIFMDVYRSNEMVADEEILLKNINYPIWQLKRILRRYAKVENH